MKKFLLPFFLAGIFNVQAQDAREWLSLTPISVEKPAFSETKNVKDKTFTEEMLADYNSLNIRNLVPDANKTEDRFHQLKWTIAATENDTIVATEQEAFSLNHYAVYFSNSEWISGKLHFHLFGNAEIYVDGIKKITVNENKATTRQIPGEWLPGKHTIVIKSITKGGKVAFARFEADKEFENAPVEFSTSPQRGKTIYDILNGKRVSNLQVSPTGKYAVVGITTTSQGKSVTNTYVFRIAD